MMLALGGDVDPLVKDHSRDTGSHEIVTIAQVATEATLAQHLTDAHARYVDERINMSVVDLNPTQRAYYWNRTGEIWTRGVVGGAFSMQVDGDRLVDGDTGLNLISADDLKVICRAACRASFLVDQRFCFG